MNCYFFRSNRARRLRVLSFVLSVLLVGGLLLLPADISSADSYNQPDIRVFVNDQEVEFDTVPEIVGNRTFVPMRNIFEALNAEITWNEGRSEVVANMNFDELVLKIGSKIAIHNTDIDELDAAPYIKGGRTMMPLRYLSEKLGYDVEWDASARTIKITSDDPRQLLFQKPEEEDSEAELTETTGSAIYDILGDNASISYDEAVNRVIRVSPSTKQARLTSDKTEQLSNEFNSSYNNAPYFTSTMIQSAKNMALTKNWVEKQVVLTDEQTGYQMMNSLDAISLKLAEIEKEKATLVYTKSKRETAQIQYDTGSISKKELEAAGTAVTTQEKVISSLQTELEGLYIKLYGTLSYEYNGEYDVLPEFTLSYEEIGEVDIDDLYRYCLNNDPYIWYLDNSQSNAEYTLKTYDYNVAAQSYALTAFDLKQAKENVSNTKASLETTLYSRYNQIIQLENNIDKLNDSLDSLRESIDTLRTQYETGMISKQIFEDALQNESTIQYNLLSLKISHGQLVSIFEKPYLAPEYMSAG